MDAMLAQTAVTPAIGFVDLVLLVGLMVAGLMLWLMGVKLVRGACVLCGFIIGGFLGLLICESMLQAGEGFYLVVLTLGGAIAGALVAGLLFRFWMAFSAAVVFGVLFPSTVMILSAGAGPTMRHDISGAGAIDWKAEAQAHLGDRHAGASGEATAANGKAGFEFDLSDATHKLLPDDTGVWQDIRKKLESGDLSVKVGDSGFRIERRNGDEVVLVNDAGDVIATGAAGDQADASERNTPSMHDRAGVIVGQVTEHGRHMLGAVGAWVRETVAAQSAWWDNLDAAVRNRMILAAIAGVVFGLVAGLLFPKLAATLQSVAVGSVLVLQPACLLWAYYLPDQAGWLPGTWRAYLLCLIVLSVVGFSLQLLITRRRSN